MRSDAVIRWGIAGPGAIAARFAEGMRERRRRHGRRRRLAVRSSGRETFADAFDIPRRYGSYEALADDADVDAVYVAHATLAPRRRHAAVPRGRASTCSARSRSRSNADAGERHGRGAPRSSDRFVMEAMWSRFLPAYVALRDSSTDGRIGEPLLVEADFGWRSRVVPTHRHFDLEQGGGALLDLGVYPVQLCSFVLGPAGCGRRRRVMSAHRRRRARRRRCCTMPVVDSAW